MGSSFASSKDIRVFIRKQYAARINHIDRVGKKVKEMGLYPYYYIY